MGSLPHLEADCAQCFGLCCVALPFARSADFPVDKAGGDPCRNLLADHRCGIHDRLLEGGWRGCVTFDCFGAGQQVSQVTFGGVSWRDAPGTAPTMYAVLPVMRQLHEMLVHLQEASRLGRDVGPDSAAGGSLAEVAELMDEVSDLTTAAPDALLALDLVGLRARVGSLLRTVSATVRQRHRRRDGIREQSRRARRVGPGADLVGADLRGLDLRAVDLRGALLIAADLRGADLRWADLLGADLRDADLRGAAVQGALFVTRPQLAAART